MYDILKNDIDKLKFMKLVNTVNSCWIWTGRKDRDGYGTFNHNGHRIQAHRISYAIYNGKTPSNLYVCHTCDNPTCVNPQHLFLATQQDNMDDMKHKNRSNIGSKSPTAKLIENDIYDIIIDIYNNKYLTVNDVSTKYNVEYQTIMLLLDGKTWTHVTKNLTVPLSIIKSKIVHGTLGQNSPNAKLNDDIVREIKYRLLKVREKMTTLAIEYNISYNYIQKIKYGKVWKHIILK